MNLNRIPHRIRMIKRDLPALYHQLVTEQDKEKRAALKQRVHLTERKRNRLEKLWRLK